MSCYETFSIVAQFSVVAATVAYVVFARRQWEEIRRQANIAETALKKIGRAYLSVTNWQLLNFIPGKDAEARCFFVNAGQRPAKIKKNFCGYCFSEKLPPIPDYTRVTPTYEGEPITIQPREEKLLPLAIYNLNTTDYGNIRSGEKRLYFYGYFIYDDPIDGEHKTTFFAWYDVNKDSGQFSQVYDLGYNTSD